LLTYENEVGDVLVSVIYNENKNCGTVHFSRLESLINSGLIFAFRRSHEWVIIEPAEGRDGGTTACAGTGSEKGDRTGSP
jgi:hypothetical protein